MLRIVVVPGDVIKIQEREHFVAIFLQAFDDLARFFALAESIRKTMVEAIDENPVFPQEVFLRPRRPTVSTIGVTKLLNSPASSLSPLS
jgi:hypothetical protein